MLKITRFLFLLFLSHSLFAHAQAVDVQVCFINHSQYDCVFHPPLELSTATNIDSIVLTFKDVDIIVDNESSYTADKWGVLFSSPGKDGGVSEKFYCNQLNCAQKAVEVDANNQDIKVVRPAPSGTQQNHLTGKIVITLSRFKNGQLPSRLQSLINSATNGSISVYATYSDATDTDGTQARTSDPFTWQPDEGTLRDAPLLSALARSGGLVVNFKPPKDLSSVKQNSALDPTTLMAATSGHVTGYLLALWLARDLDGTQPCVVPGTWQFGVNPLTYNSTVGIPTLSCVYTPYIDADGIGGTTAAIGCMSAPAIPPPVLPYLNQDPPPLVPTLTADLVAVPSSITSPASKIELLKKLIAHPAQEQTVPGACYTIVYVPTSQSSYGKMGIEKGQIYGFTAWALNGAYTTADPTPNLSLAHANLGFMTAGDFELASLAKDPSLKLTTVDCFVATAASGDVNSDSVFYWRILRDEYLTRLGITKIYYQHAPKWAEWLNEHPQYKPPVNFVLEKSGAFFYFSALYTKKAIKKIKVIVSDLWEQKASASEYHHTEDMNAQNNGTNENDSDPADEYSYQEQNADIQTNHYTPQDEYTETDNSVLHQTDFYAQSDDEYSQADEYAQADATIKIGQTINYDLALTGGVLFPTSDKNLYNKYYPHATFDLELSSSMIFWTSNFGWSVGLKGTYGYNSDTFLQHTLGDATQQDTRNLYLGAIEVIGGARYRNINFLFLQPGIFVGAGVLRLREEGRAKDDTGDNGAGTKNQTQGVTNYSPVFDFGANLDISLSTLFMYSERELALSRDILLRLSAAYRLNPSKALSASGLVVNAGFAFLF